MYPLVLFIWSPVNSSHKNECFCLVLQACFQFITTFNFFLIFVYLFLSVLGLPCHAWLLSSCLEQGLLSCCGAQALGAQASVAVTRRLQSPGSVAVVHQLVAQRHVGSSQTRDQIHVPCTGRQILNPWDTKEVPSLSIYYGYFYLYHEDIYFQKHQ